MCVGVSRAGWTVYGNVTMATTCNYGRHATIRKKIHMFTKEIIQKKTGILSNRLYDYEKVLIFIQALFRTSAFQEGPQNA